MLISGIVVILSVLIIGIILIQNGIFGSAQQMQYEEPLPEAVVRQYFTAWSIKDWPNMYATISDGFKKIDPNAKDLATFRNFASSQGIEGVKITSLREESNYGTTASVAYSVEFALSDGSTRSFSDRFTLKFRQGDIIPGWKLVHPYGQNVDTS